MGGEECGREGRDGEECGREGSGWRGVWEGGE